MDDTIKFNIREYDFNPDLIYEEFKKDFINPRLTRNDLMEKFNLNRRRYQILHGLVSDETGIKRKPSLRGDNKVISDTTYIYYLQKLDKYIISKSINEELRYFGQYDTLEEAVMVRDELIKHDWDESIININRHKKNNTGVCVE